MQPWSGSQRVASAVPRPGSRFGKAIEGRLPIHMEPASELLHTPVKRHLTAIWPKRLAIAAAAMLVIALATMNFLVGIGQPAQPIWDEKYYLTAAQRYEDGTAQFASHPPLGLMLIAAGDALLRPNHEIDTHPIGWDKQVTGDHLPKRYSFAGVRLMSALFAVIGAALFFAIMLNLTHSVLQALLLSNLYVFENSFMAHFRAAHLDSFQLVFAMLALLCFISSVRRGLHSSGGLDFLLGAACGLATMVKLNAVLWTLLGVMLILRRAIIGRRCMARPRLFMNALRDGAVMATGCLAAIAAVFLLLVELCPHLPPPGSPAGGKDQAFISPPYRAYLEGKAGLSAGVVLTAAQDYTRFMLADQKTIPLDDPNGSRPILWPLNTAPINYRWDSDGVRTAYIQLTGNPWSWLVADIAIIAAVGLLILPRRHPCPSSDPERRALMLMLLLHYMVFMAAHACLATMRVMYLYHYFLGLLLAFCLVPLTFAEACERWPALRAGQQPALVAFTVLLLAGFTFFSPLSLHRPLTHAQCERRNVLQHVVDCQ